jgi:hypothetical protein
MSRILVIAAVSLTSLALAACTGPAGRTAGHWEPNPGGGGRNFGMRWVPDRSDAAGGTTDGTAVASARDSGRWVTNHSAGGRSQGMTWVRE